MLVQMAHKFDLVLVGEWVGDESSVRLLEKAGVSYMQGDFFGPPKAYEDKAKEVTLAPVAETAS